MDKFFHKNVSYCDPPDLSAQEARKAVRRQLYVEAVKNEKILEKMHHGILNEFAKVPSSKFESSDFMIEEFSKVEVGFARRVAYLLTGKPIDYNVISSIDEPYHAVERCHLIAETFENKYKDFPLVLECDYTGYNDFPHDRNVHLRAKFTRKDL